MQVAQYTRVVPIGEFAGRVLRKLKIFRGEVVKENLLSVWVKASDGKIIKRNRFKHGVIVMSEELYNLLHKEPYIDEQTKVQLQIAKD